MPTAAKIGVFDRIEIGAVGREEKHPAARRFDGFTRCEIFVGRQIVEDDNELMRWMPPSP